MRKQIHIRLYSGFVATKLELSMLTIRMLWVSGTSQKQAVRSIRYSGRATGQLVQKIHWCFCAYMNPKSVPISDRAKEFMQMHHHARTGDTGLTVLITIRVLPHSQMTRPIQPGIQRSTHRVEQFQQPDHHSVMQSGARSGTEKSIVTNQV